MPKKGQQQNKPKRSRNWAAAIIFDCRQNGNVFEVQMVTGPISERTITTTSRDGPVDDFYGIWLLKKNNDNKTKYFPLKKP